MVALIGYNTKSATVGGITYFVFFSQFVNIAIIIALANANMKYGILSFTGLDESPYTDFTQNWYDYVGFTIALTMFL